MSPAAVVVRAVAALPAVRGGEQGGRARSASAHPAGAAPGLPQSGPAALPRPHAAASWHGKARTRTRTVHCSVHVGFYTQKVGLIDGFYIYKALYTNRKLLAF